MNNNDMIFGIRAVIEAVEADKEIDKIFIRKDLSGELAQELFALIKEHNILTQRVPLERLNRFTRKNHQGVVALLSAVTYYKLDQIVPELYESGSLPFIVVLDGITDVRNFGAIARTCECAGVDAIVIPERGSVSVNADAVKTSAGALHHIPVCREKSTLQAIKYLKNCGYKVVAVSEKADINYTLSDYTVPVALVLGAEDTGITPEVLKECDVFVSIPMFGHIASLNVSVAGAVMIYEVVRQRLNANLEVI